MMILCMTTLESDPIDTDDRFKGEDDE